MAVIKQKPVHITEGETWVEKVKLERDFLFSHNQVYPYFKGLFNIIPPG
ncbi:hypothetical protein FHW89_001416 [Mucilaginibacter sp. SG564]|nr:hypothetical protein [Mucilaginibacter sp. SG564]